MKIKRKKYTPEEFRADFKVGDVIESWSTGKRLLITAIGEKRFLGRDFRGHERANTMTHSFGWTKVEITSEINSRESSIEKSLRSFCS